MSVVFQGDGLNTSSINFGSLTLTNNPTLSSAVDMIEQNLEIIESDAGYRTIYQKGERQKPSKMRFNLLTDSNHEQLREWIETLKGGSNWFTLQDQNVGIKTAIAIQTGGTSAALKNTTDLVSANWPVRPIGQWATFISGTAALLGKRRRINYYVSTIISIDPALATTPAIGDTFIIGLPVFLINNPVFRRVSAIWWEVEFEFQEVGGYN